MREWLWKNRKELILYSIVGLFGVIVDYSTFFVLRWMMWPVIIAQWSAGILGSLHNHLWFHYVVFKHNQKIQRTSFWSLWLVVFGIILSGPALLLVEFFVNNLILSKLLVIAFFTMVQYVIRKKWIFILK